MMYAMATDSRIGTIIRRARERKQWTQQQLADAAGVSLRTVNDWENGRSSPRNRIGALEEILGVRLDAIPEEPPISPELRAMIDALTPGERAWVMEQLTAADRRLRRREDPEPEHPAQPPQEAAG